MSDDASSHEDQGRPGFTGFLRDTWIWWLLPLLVVLGLVVVLLWSSEGDATSPFIYDVF